MKNLHLLPTDKPSSLSILNNGKLNFGAEIMSSSNSKPQNIYITNDEEFKEGDWVLYENPNNLKKLVVKVTTIENGKFDYERQTLDIREIPIKWGKKIILTTDPILIADGVQAIDDEFLQWFVNNPSCENVEIKTEYLGSKCLKCGFVENHDEVDSENCPKCKNFTYEHLYNYNKIIIPKEEPNFHVGQRVIVCNTLKTTITKIEDEKYYFLDEIGNVMWDEESSLEPIIEPKQTVEEYEQQGLEKHSFQLEKETLEEFIESYVNRIDRSEDGLVEQCLKDGAKWQINKQDEFIIGFLEFIEGTYSYSNIFNYWYLHADTSKTYTKKELLKKYNDTLNGN